ncbi:hypothetical protein JCM8097_007857 [Rhodosporidiobolus ruineniae]
MNAHHQKRSYRPSPPKRTARFSSGSFASSSTSRTDEPNKLSKVAGRMPFGWQLDALVPSTGSSSTSNLADELEKAVKESGDFYLCENVNLADLLEVGFLNSHIRQGSLVALTLDDDGAADVVAIDGRGRLVLSVSKDTYELLGLPGRASAFGTFRQRFIIEISLIDPSFRAGKLGFERVKRLLREWPAQTDLFDALAGVGTSGASEEKKGRTFDMVMSFTDAEDRPQPITFPSSITSRLCHPTSTRQTLSSIRVPLPSSFPSASSSSTAPSKKQRTSSGAFRKPVDEKALFWDGYREWAGLAQLGEQEKIAWRALKEGEEEEEDEWGVPLGTCEEGEVTLLSWTGLLHPQAMVKVFERITTSASFSTHPFLSLSLRPFPHSPLSHLSAANPPVVGTSKTPNGKKRKRGRGRGEEEEAKRERVEEGGGWEVVLRAGEEGRVEYWSWEGQ